jgi:hypothetical protein
MKYRGLAEQDNTVGRTRKGRETGAQEEASTLQFG